MTTACARCVSCNAPVLWCRTRDGRWMPVDPMPVDGGNLRIEGEIRPGVAPRATVIADIDRKPGMELYQSHFATCPNAGQHRRR